MTHPTHGNKKGLGFLNFTQHGSPKCLDVGQI